MTWSGLKGVDILTDAYTICVRVQAVCRRISVRYTSYEFYVVALSSYKFIQAFMLTSWAVANLCFFYKTPS